MSAFKLPGKVDFSDFANATVKSITTGSDQEVVIEFTDGRRIQLWANVEYIPPAGNVGVIEVYVDG